MKIIEKYTLLIGKRFGKLIFSQLEEIKSKSNRSSCMLHFICDCGKAKKYTTHQVSKIIDGSTISCGCVRKDKWRKSYYAWKKNVELECVNHRM